MLSRPDPESVELEAALRRAYGLSARDQLRLLRTLHDYALAADGISAAVPQVVLEREEALVVMNRVATHLGLPQGTSPKTTEFKTGVADMNFTDWNVTRVGNAFRKSYKLARAVYEGGQMPETVEQEALRRATTGRRRSHEAYITGVRQFLQWLKTQPKPACDDDGVSNYNRYVIPFNRQALQDDSDIAPLVRSDTVRVSLGLSWSLVLAVAREELTYDEARRRHLAVQGDDEGPLRLVARASVAIALGVSKAVVDLKRERGELPPAAVRLTRSGSHAWLRDDIDALAAGEPVPDRVAGWMQDQVVLLPELAARLGRQEDALRTALHKRRRTVPQSDGRVGGVRYWTREHVEAWCSGNAESAKGSDLFG